MTAEEVVMSAYAAFGAGDMDALAKLNHPECTYKMHAQHALSGQYVGFPAFLECVLSQLDEAWPGFAPNIDKVVSNETDVCVFCTCTADGGLSGKAVHHFVVKDELQFSFDIYWDSEYWGAHSKI